MKDVNNVGVALQMALTVLENASIQSGRTTRMLNQLKDGDTVLCVSGRDCEYLRRKWRDLMDEQLNPIQGVTFQVLNLHKDGMDLYRIRHVSGNVHFDHNLIQLIYMNRIESVERTLNMINNTFGNKRVMRVKKALSR